MHIAYIRLERRDGFLPVLHSTQPGHSLCRYSKICSGMDGIFEVHNAVVIHQVDCRCAHDSRSCVLNNISRPYTGSKDQSFGRIQFGFSSLGSTKSTVSFSNSYFSTTPSSSWTLRQHLPEFYLSTSTLFVVRSYQKSASSNI